MRSRFFCFLGCALSLTPLADTVCAGTEEFVTLRVVTLNVKEGLIGPSGSAYDAVSDMITTVDQVPANANRGLNPDVVCFQELDADNTATLLAFRDQFLPGYRVFGDDSNGDNFNYQAILVRPDITVRSAGRFETPGPRDGQFVVLEVPGSDEFVKIFTAHFKAFGDSASRETRTNEANSFGNVIAGDIASGFIAGAPIERQHVILAGDLNSNSNFDGTLDGLFFSSVLNEACCAPEDGSADADFLSILGVDCATMSPCCVPGLSLGLCNAVGGTLTSTPSPTGLTDILYESLSASQFSGTSQTGTFGNSRLDYIMANRDLALRFDASMNGALSQSEANQIGYVYRSEQNVSGVHTPGQFANGNSNATNNASDHRPVVAEFRFLPALPTGGCCLENACFVLTEANCVAMSGTYLGDGTDCADDPCAPANDCQADLNSDGTVDIIDFGVFGSAFGSMAGDPNFEALADFNGDLRIDIIDFGVFGGEFGRSDCLLGQ